MLRSSDFEKFESQIFLHRYIFLQKNTNVQKQKKIKSISSCILTTFRSLKITILSILNMNLHMLSKCINVEMRVLCAINVWMEKIWINVCEI